jgi:hypothetical protein
MDTGDDLGATEGLKNARALGNQHRGGFGGGEAAAAGGTLTTTTNGSAIIDRARIHDS